MEPQSYNFGYGGYGYVSLNVAVSVIQKESADHNAEEKSSDHDAAGKP